MGADLETVYVAAAWVPSDAFQELYVQMHSAYTRHKTISDDAKQAKADETMKRQERAKLAVQFVGDRVRGKRARHGSPEETASAAVLSPPGAVCQQDSATGSGTSSSSSGGGGKKLAKRSVVEAVDSLGSVTAFLQQSVQAMQATTAAAGCHAPAPAPAVHPLAASTLRAELAALTSMKEEGILSEEEYRLARAGAIAGRR